MQILLCKKKKRFNRKKLWHWIAKKWTKIILKSQNRIITFILYTPFSNCCYMFRNNRKKNENEHKPTKLNVIKNLRQTTQHVYVTLYYIQFGSARFDCCCCCFFSSRCRKCNKLIDFLINFDIWKSKDNKMFDEMSYKIFVLC